MTNNALDDAITALLILSIGLTVVIYGHNRWW